MVLTLFSKEVECFVPFFKTLTPCEAKEHQLYKEKANKKNTPTITCLPLPALGPLEGRALLGLAEVGRGAVGAPEVAAGVRHAEAAAQAVPGV